jgi:hypothetical protein
MLKLARLAPLTQIAVETLKTVRGEEIFDLQSDKLKDIKLFLSMFD